jgi:hypothetical protein
MRKFFAAVFGFTGGSRFPHCLMDMTSRAQRSGFIQPESAPLPLMGHRNRLHVHSYEIVAFRLEYPKTKASKR